MLEEVIFIRVRGEGRTLAAYSLYFDPGAMDFVVFVIPKPTTSGSCGCHVVAMRRESFPTPVVAMDAFLWHCARLQGEALGISCVPLLG